MTTISEPATSPPRKSTTAVLIVEDEPRLREMLTRFVETCGMNALPARSGEEALKLLHGAAVDVVLLDLNLPGMSGLECFERLRRERPEAGVVILTGFADVESARSAIRLGVADFLTKPCHLGELEVALDRALRRTGRGGPPASDPTEGEAADATLASVERRHILKILAKHDGNRARAAAELGISLRTLYYRLDEYQQAGEHVD